MLDELIQANGNNPSVISAISAIEITHGMYRAKTESDKERRRIFAQDLFRDVVIQPVTLPIAQLAGRIEGEQAEAGNTLPFEDLVIGATALAFGFSVLTSNLRHFRRIPGLSVIQH